jgi:hypothetical protein
MQLRSGSWEAKKTQTSPEIDRNCPEIEEKTSGNI